MLALSNGAAADIGPADGTPSAAADGVEPGGGADDALVDDITDESSISSTKPRPWGALPALVAGIELGGVGEDIGAADFDVLADEKVENKSSKSLLTEPAVGGTTPEDVAVVVALVGGAADAVEVEASDGGATPRAAAPLATGVEGATPGAAAPLATGVEGAAPEADGAGAAGAVGARAGVGRISLIVKSWPNFNPLASGTPNRLLTSSIIGKITSSLNVSNSSGRVFPNFCGFKSNTSGYTPCLQS